MQFKDIVGQTEVKNQLIHAVNSGRISHAQLFLGPEGSGHLGLALAYAQFLLCQHRTERDSCGECPSCKKIAKLQHPDLHFSFPFFTKKGGQGISDDWVEEWRDSVIQNPYIDLDEWREGMNAENKMLIIPAKEAGNIISKLTLKSYEGGYKIVVIWYPENMKQETANGLLKIIEEPPQKTVFLLVAENHERIISTILSRTQLIKVPQIQDSDLEAHLKTSNLPTESIEHVVNYANGNLLKAQRLISSTANPHEHLNGFTHWMRFCYAGNRVELLKWADELHKLGKQYSLDFLRYSSHMVRQCLVGNYTAGELMRLTPDEMNFAQKFSRFINDRNAMEISREIELAIRDVNRNGYRKLVLFDLSLNMIKMLRA